MKEEIEWFRPKDKLPDYGKKLLIQTLCGIEVDAELTPPQLWFGRMFKQGICFRPPEAVIAWAEMPKGIK